MPDLWRASPDLSPAPMLAPRLPRGPYRARTGTGDTARTLVVADGPDGAITLDGAAVEGGVEFVATGPGRYRLRTGTVTREVVVEGRDGTSVTLSVGGTRVVVDVADAQAQMLERFGMGAGTGAAQREVRSPMPGLVLAVHVREGETVEAGQRLLVLEAMKMENEIKAAHAGTIARVHAVPGAAVAKGAPLVEFAEG